MSNQPTARSPTADDGITLRWVTRAFFLAASVAWPFSTVPQATAWALRPQAFSVCIAAWSVWALLCCAGCPSTRHLRLAAATALLIGQALALGVGVGVGAVSVLGNNGGLFLFVLTASFGALSVLARKRGGGDPPRLLAMALLLFGGAFVWLAWRLGPLGTMRPSMVCAMASALALAAVQLAALRTPSNKHTAATRVEAGRSRTDAQSQGCRDALRLLCGCCLLHAPKTPQPWGLLDAPHRANLKNTARALYYKHLVVAFGFVAACYGAGRAMHMWDRYVAPASKAFSAHNTLPADNKSAASDADTKAIQAHPKAQAKRRPAKKPYVHNYAAGGAPIQSDTDRRLACFKKDKSSSS